MANPEIHVDVENSESIPGLVNLPTTNGQSAMNDQGRNRPNRKLPTIKKILNPQGPYRSRWKKLYFFFCIMGVLVDPILFYIPLANQEKKCIELHTSLLITAVILRFMVDLSYAVHGFYLFRTGVLQASVSKKQKKFRSMSHDVSALIPSPQMLILYGYKTYTSTETTKICSISTLVVYIQRVIPIYQITTERSKNTGKVWLHVMTFSIFQFILASHVFGGLWFNFSIQRLMACWEKNTCGSGKKSEVSFTLLCKDHKSIRNITLLNDKCPTNPPNTAVYDFGIFLDQTGIVGSKDILRKLTYGFWWGLTNLSSLGQSLKTNTELEDNVFAIFIFVCGMVLYVKSLNGSLQLGDKVRQEAKVRRKMKIKDKEVESWLFENGLPDNMKREIMKHVKEEVEENKDVDVENILSILPSKQKSVINEWLRLAILKKVPEFQNMNDDILKAICKHLKPVTYAEGSEIVREGQPLDMMLFITQGLVQVYSTSNGGRIGSSSGINKFCKRGDFYGSEETLNWALNIFSSFSDLRVSTGTTFVKSVTKVEAMALMANDLKSVVSEFWWHFSKELPDLTDSQLEQMKPLAVSSIQKIWRRHHPKTDMNPDPLLTQATMTNVYELIFLLLYFLANIVVGMLLIL